MRALEPRLLAGADAVIAVDEQEADWIRARVTATPVHTVPFGVPIRTQPKPERTEGFLILGSWSWEPNREAAGWFVREVWPLVRATSAEAKATIAGRDSGPAGLGSGAADVLWAGEVPEVESYLLAARALVVPLLTGAGLRVKILEAMSYGTAVITTPEGLGGLSPVDGVHVLVARGPRAMADAVMSLERDPERARRIGEAGRAWVTERFGLPIVRGRLYAAVQDGADRGRARLSKT